MKSGILQCVVALGAVLVGAGGGVLARSSATVFRNSDVAPCDVGFVPRNEVLPQESRQTQPAVAFEDRKASAIWPAVSSKMRPLLARRFGKLKRCLDFNTRPHPKSQVAVDWRLRVQGDEFEAKDFVLEATVGIHATQIASCFQTAFADPIGVVLKGGAADRYEVPGPELIVFTM
jgi:hypothetical protein